MLIYLHAYKSLYFFQPLFLCFFLPERRNLDVEFIWAEDKERARTKNKENFK